VENAEHEFDSCQRQTFPDKFKSLQSSNHLKRSGPLYKLDPLVQDGIIRVGGHLNQSAMPDSEKQPVLIDKKQHVTSFIDNTQAIVAEIKCLQTCETNLGLLLQVTVIRKLISKCTVCRRLNAKVNEQKMADLPRERVLPDNPPFTHTGVDYFGPVSVK